MQKHISAPNIPCVPSLVEQAWDQHNWWTEGFMCVSHSLTTVFLPWSSRKMKTDTCQGYLMGDTTWVREYSRWPVTRQFIPQLQQKHNCNLLCFFHSSVIVILAYHSFRASDLSFQRRYGSFQKRYGICKKSSCYRVNKVSGAQICHVHDQQEEQQVAHGEAHFT